MSSITLIPGKEKRVYSGHPWVFRSDILSVKEPGERCQAAYNYIHLDQKFL